MDKKKSRQRLLTGDRPTGSLHIGHFVGSLANRVKLQESYDCFFIIADFQVLTDHLTDAYKVRDNIREIVLDYLAVGIDPKKSSIFIQSQIPELAELTMYFSFLVTVPRLQRNPTVKDEMKSSKIGSKELSYGFLGYPVSQAADILSVRANLVPVGEDQLPHLEQTREIARSFNRFFGEIFPVPEGLISEFPRLPGLDGQKMSKSRHNAIFLKDTAEEVNKKVMSAYTDPSRLKATDPGHIEGNVVFSYFDAFAPDKEEVAELKAKYKKGQIGDVILKKRLGEILNQFLTPIRVRRAEYEAKPRLVSEILAQGINQTRAEAQKTLQLAREAMKYDYRDLIGKI